jgi:hypothetical protein
MFQKLAEFTSLGQSSTLPDGPLDRVIRDWAPHKQYKF